MKTSFSLEDKRLKRIVVKSGAKRVLLQLPEGLKPEAPRLAAAIQEAGALPVISADPCYGACDIPLLEAEALGVDLIVHYGHTPFIQQNRVPIVYFDAKAKMRIRGTVKKALPLLEETNRIGLVTTLQHLHAIKKAREILLENGKTVAIGDASPMLRAGQVIGCDYSNARSIAREVEAFLFIGGGKFHAIGVSLATAKPTFVADPYLRKAYSVDQQVRKVLRQRLASIYEAKKAKLFGVLLGLKTGQKRFKKALEVKKKLEEKGKKTVLLALREVTPERLMQFPDIEAFVNTACPRLSLDDAPKFRKPILTVRETAVLTGEMEWDELCQKGWFENVA